MTTDSAMQTFAADHGTVPDPWPSLADGGVLDLRLDRRWLLRAQRDGAEGGLLLAMGFEAPALPPAELVALYRALLQRNLAGRMAFGIDPRDDLVSLRLSLADEELSEPRALERAVAALLGAAHELERQHRLRPADAAAT